MGDIQDKVAEAKAWYTSKTIIGIVLAFIPTIIKFIKPELVIDVEGSVEEAFAGAEVIAETADSIWGMLLATFGTVLAIYGRIKANLSIK